MKTKNLLLLGFVAALLGGCVVQTIQPLFTDKEYISYPSLVGTWLQKEDDREVGRWTFATHERQYELTHTDEKGNKATFYVSAGKIGTNVFFDSFPANPLPGAELNGVMQAQLIGVHIFAKVVKTNDALMLVAMDYEWFDQYLEKNPQALAHIVQDKRRIVTATTEELQKFVAKYANDEKVFKNVVKLVRQIAKP